MLTESPASGSTAKFAAAMHPGAVEHCEKVANAAAVSVGSVGGVVALTNEPPSKMPPRPAARDRGCLVDTRKTAVGVRTAVGPVERRSGQQGVASDVPVQLEERRNAWTAYASPPDAP